MGKRWYELLAVFLAAMSTLLFEIVVTKIFEFSVWANYAYLVISTAMFGLGFSGVILMRWRRLLNARDGRFLFCTTVATGVAIWVAFFVINTVPINLPDAPRGWALELLAVGIDFFALSLPFTFFGLMISFLLHHRGREANVYYFADLIGAGVGAVILVPLIPIWWPQGIIFACGFASMAAACLFAAGVVRGPWRATALVGGGLLLVVGSLGAPKFAASVPLHVHVAKREFKIDQARGAIEATAWSALSRVDIAYYQHHRKKVWIAGGVNESLIYHFDGKLEDLPKRRDEVLKRAEANLDYHPLPHLSKKNHKVCVIGTSGGVDSVWALMCGARKVVGVEMDPRIAKFVTVDYHDFAGGLFTDGKMSELVVDEGRSYLRRSDEQFDVIQQVNNFTPIAFQNGALNLSETYLLTVESFRDFYKRLTDDGLICISRWGSIRVLSLAIEMFRQMGMSVEDYSRHLVVCEGPSYVLNTCMIKKSPFTREEVDTLFDYYNGSRSAKRILFAPYRTDDLPNPDRNIYYLMATADNPEKYWRVGGFTFAPTTDDKPFFNHFQVLGVPDKGRGRLALLPREVRDVVPRSKVDRRIPRGDLPPFIVLCEAILLSTLFFGLPLLTAGELREKMKRERRALGYFACLGAGFILIEMCLIQRLVLFLGAPVYSISLVLGSLLVSAGVGSLLSGRLPPTQRTVSIMLPAVAIVLIALHLAIPAITHVFLGGSFPTRVMAAGFISTVAGLAMGMPMPTGIRLLKDQGRDIIPWAWAINGYFTVIGTALSVLLAVNLGFSVVFYCAAALYVAAPLFLRPRVAASP